MMTKLRLIIALLATVITAGALTLTPTQRALVQQRTRVIARDTVTCPGHVITTLRKGDATWQTTNKLAQINVSIAPHKISKLKLIIILKSVDKWTTVKRFIADHDLTDEWINCQYISTDFPLFISATNVAVRTGMATDSEIKTLIEKSYDD